MNAPVFIALGVRVRWTDQARQVEGTIVGPGTNGRIKIIDDRGLLHQVDATVVEEVWG